MMNIQSATLTLNNVSFEGYLTMDGNFRFLESAVIEYFGLDNDALDAYIGMDSPFCFPGISYEILNDFLYFLTTDYETLTGYVDAQEMCVMEEDAARIQGLWDVIKA